VTELKPSKSARKREYLALQKLGEELITVKRSDLDNLPLDDALREAVHDAREIKAHGALRRQKQYIGKLMRNVDPEPIRAGLQHLRHK
jgi:ribosome-associated protein